MPTTVKRKSINALLRHLKSTKSKEEYRELLLQQLYYSFGNTKRRLILRIIRTHILKEWGTTEEGQKQFNADFAGYVEKVRKAYEQKVTTHYTVDETTGKIDDSIGI